MKETVHNKTPKSVEEERKRWIPIRESVRELQKHRVASVVVRPKRPTAEDSNWFWPLISGVVGRPANSEELNRFYRIIRGAAWSRSGISRNDC